MALINLRELGMVTPRPLFQNLTLTAGPGDRIGLVAANGAGKSTLLRCVAGQTAPDAGSVVALPRRAARFRRAGRAAPRLLALTLQEMVRRALPAADARAGGVARGRGARRVRDAGGAARSGRRRAQRRLAAARSAGPGLDHRAGRAAAGRADQPSRRREDRPAGGAGSTARRRARRC